MINIVELMVTNESLDVGQLKNMYLHGISEFLSDFGYDVAHVDKSDWYSFEQKLLVDTNAPEPLVSTAVEQENKKQKYAYGVLVN